MTSLKACPGNEVAPGTKAIALMGGLGRSRPGIYGTYVTIPLTNLLPITTNLPWEDLAALPEQYFTAACCVFTVLDIQPHEKLLVRGATSTIGAAALDLAVDAGVEVTATTRRADRLETLQSWGAKEAVIESPELPSLFTDSQGNVKKFDKILNLICNSVLLQSVSLTRPGGRMLQAGWLGGLAPVKDFNRECIFHLNAIHE
jgi:NADPH:quinone reductase